MKTRLNLVVSGIGAMLMGLGSAHAITDPELDYQGLRYACTGLAAESRDDPRWQNYSTKLVFAAAGGAYLANVGVTIADDANRIVLEARCLSPWLLVDLAPGRYHVQAVARQTLTKRFDLEIRGGGQLEYTVRFPEIMD
ncbi:MAG: hypothetical protein ACREEE_02900 [Dongiaceae bacterium]